MSLSVLEHLTKKIDTFSTESIIDIIDAIFEDKSVYSNDSSYLKTLESIVIRIGEGSFLKKWLNILLSKTESVFKIAQQSYLHKNGFVKIVLANSSKFKIRLHIWNENNPNNEDIHNHRWAFASKILSGYSEQYIFEEDISENNFYLYQYEPNPRTLNFELTYKGIRSLKCIDVQKFYKNQYYSLTPQVIHQIYSPNSTTISLVVTGIPQNENCNLYSKKSIAVREVLNTKTSESFIVNCLQKIIKLI